MDNEVFEANVKLAESKFKNAKTADDIRAIWKEFYLIVGHKALGRMLVGKTADNLLERRYERVQ